MAYVVEKSGKTVQEAIDLALEELEVDENDVEIEVLDEGSKGIFGLLGNKAAKVRVTIKEESVADLAVGFLSEVFEKMNIKVKIKVFEDEDSIYLEVNGRDSGIIIGRRGETLDSLQYLTNLVVNKDTDNYTKVTLDIENYRAKREETLIRLANRLAGRVVKFKKNITLEPMNPYERRIIHSSLQNNKNVETYSVGEDPNRKVVIALRQTAGNMR
jgi:spoIIIJ-associated protein